MTKSSDRQGSKNEIDRRAFLKSAGLGVIATGASAIDLGAAEAGGAIEPAPANGRYRETEHVRRAYALARF